MNYNFIDQNPLTVSINYGATISDVSECAALANPKLAYLELTQAFDALKTHINNIKPTEQNAGLIETGFLAFQFNAALDRYEHVLAMSIAVQKDKEPPKK